MSECVQRYVADLSDAYKAVLLLSDVDGLTAMQCFPSEMTNEQAFRSTEKYRLRIRCYIVPIRRGGAACPSFTQSVAGRIAGMSEFATGETTLALHPASDKNPAGNVELGFTVADVEAFYREMSAKGVLFSTPPKKQEFGGETCRSGRAVRLTLYVPDADAAWKKALAAGCKVASPIREQFWGDRYGEVEDPFGFVWAIATHLEDLTPEEIEVRRKKMFGGGPSRHN